jgi:uncharacterized protein YbcC (UPF0753/DUF2309 family)
MTSDISQHENSTNLSSGFNLDASIEHLTHWLPIQGPIKDFVHHNILHAFQQQRSFHDALSVAGKLFGARSYLPIDDYQALYKQGRIKDYALDWALKQTGCNANQQQAIRDTLFLQDTRSHYPPVSLANDGLRNAWRTHLEIDLNAQVHPVMFRLLSSFLDQGISRWTMPKKGERFWDSVVRLTQNSLLPLYPFNEPAVADLLIKTPDQVILACLQKIVGNEANYPQYILEVLLSHPGWSGMVRVIEQNPQSLLVKRQISIKEMLAVELLCELAIVSKRKPHGFPSIAELPNLQGVPLLNEQLLQPNVPLKFRVWHDAMEWALYSELLLAIQKQPLQDSKLPEINKPKSLIQALFCIDDRECSIRRHLEEVNPAIETFGAAGFFGIDFFYKGLDDAYPVAQCPVVITPKHLVLETLDETDEDNEADVLEFSKMHYTSHSMFRGWLYTQTLGLGYAFRMAWEVFRPTSKLPGIKTLSEVTDAHTHLHLLRENDEPNADGHLLGFSLPEMADRIGGLLRNIGLTENFAALVVVVAHGSSSVNNPHFAAYDCGACSGKPGAPNARAFAWMANHDGVRAILRERGIDIPDSTRFVPAMHNTSRDEITYFDEHELVNPPVEELQTFKTSIEIALERNAHERCRWFELAPDTNVHKESHEHVKSRASSIFEPRPEYDHSNNLYCIIGRREITRNLFMDRRSFLHSYEADTDPNGEILAKILTAIFPVCGGINLQYLFSRLDNSVYGSGTKLPHNVIGLLGVANGVEGDLRTGLTQQMIEIHEPARLLIVIEQAPEIIDMTLSRVGDLKEWPDNEWVRLAACLPGSRDLFLYSQNGWEKIELPAELELPAAAESENVYMGRDTTIPVHYISGRQ